MVPSSSRRRFTAAVVVAVVAAACLPSPSRGFSSPLYQPTATLQRTAPSATEGIDIELPDFDELFDRIRQVSPLARSVLSRNAAEDDDEKKGFDACNDDDAAFAHLDWKTVESNSNKNSVVSRIDRIDNFQGLPAPLIRCRSSINGPCLGDCFANFIMDYDERKKWDTQIEQVYEAYPLYDLDAANIAMGFGKYGVCSRLGVGYCQTKKGFGVSPREQLTLCGVQHFADGSCIIWGSEMPHWQDHLLPKGARYTRAKSHLFSTTLTPTSSNESFDVEYVLQLEVGGKLPTWLTTPVVTESIKRMFHTAKSFYEKGAEGGDLDSYLKSQAADHRIFAEDHSMLMTP